MARERLPNRRGCETVQFELDGAKYTATFGLFRNGMLGEVFVQSSKVNSALDVNARDAAIACSLALQAGVTAEEISAALCRNEDGKASGPLGAALDLFVRTHPETQQ